MIYACRQAHGSRADKASRKVAGKCGGRARRAHKDHRDDCIKWPLKVN